MGGFHNKSLNYSYYFYQNKTSRESCYCLLQRITSIIERLHVQKYVDSWTWGTVWGVELVSLLLQRLLNLPQIFAPIQTPEVGRGPLMSPLWWGLCGHHTVSLLCFVLRGAVTLKQDRSTVNLLKLHKFIDLKASNTVMAIKTQNPYINPGDLKQCVTFKCWTPKQLLQQHKWVFIMKT